MKTPGKYWSETFFPLTRSVSKEVVSVGHQLMLKAGMIEQTMAGVFSYLPYGLLCLRKVEAVVRSQMDQLGQEILMPALQPKELWDKTGRTEAMGDVLMKLFGGGWVSRTVLGPTHEEVVTTLISQHVHSEHQLPLLVYQIQTKFRNEPRPQFGLVRTREFLMKDAYSFHATPESLDETYQAMKQAYHLIFKNCGLNVTETAADSGAIGGSESLEFSAGDLELGHIFKLGDKYSRVLDATFKTTKDTDEPFLMGCYGIGIGRLLAGIIENNHDDKGIVLPAAVAPYDVVITTIEQDDDAVKSSARGVAIQLASIQMTNLIDDRAVRPGVKFAEADTLGFPIRITIGKRGLADGKVEVKFRNEKNAMDVLAGNVTNYIVDVLQARRFHARADS
jgi:prolyl-tRNA synthetase